MDRAIAYFAGCVLLLVVAVFFIRMVYQLLMDSSSFVRGNRFTTLFFVAQGISIAVFIISLVFGIEGLWQVSGISVATLFVVSWFIPKPY